MTLGDGSVTVVEECIRDGCYVTDFQLDPADLRRLVSRVEDLSFVDLVDVGPGTGFGTVEPRPRPRGEEYLDVVTGVTSGSPLTTLLLPDVAGPDEIELLASYESAFDLLRVAVDVDSVRDARPLLAAVEAVDARTSLNLLKTYLVDPVEAADAARLADEFGADVVYVVDSAGGLAPPEVAAYVREIDAATAADVGFHGHDNTGHALQNSVAAVDNGATVLDASLQGLGRSAGNTQTELLCGRYPEDVSDADWRRLRDLEPLLDAVYDGTAGVPVEDVLYGLAQFHSSFEPELRAFADRRGERYTDVLVFAARNGLSTVEAVRQASENEHLTTGGSTSRKSGGD
jgi:hypothetical protein